MTRIAQVGNISAGQTLTADSILEFHAARLILLLSIVGNGKIKGLTKLAKLDFFVRYPAFFREVSQLLSPNNVPAPMQTEGDTSMIRFHYGPWDPRYYHVLPYLEANGIIMISKKGNAYEFHLTESGQQKARALAQRPAFLAGIKHMRDVKRLLGGKTGTALKELIYETFDVEIVQQPLGARIK